MDDEDFSEPSACSDPSLVMTFEEAWGCLTREDAVEIIKLYDTELTTRRGLIAELRGLGIPEVDAVIDRVLGPHGA